MTNLIDALDTYDKIPEQWRNEPEWKIIVEAARLVVDGQTKPATRIASNDGTDWWVSTWLVDGPGDYTLITPPETVR